MLKAALFLLTLAVACAADDPWDKVRQLKSGVELRIMKKGVAQAVMARFDEANDENLIVVVKNAQVAIPRDQIDRIDYRPQSGTRVTKETKTSQDAPDKQAGPPRGPGESSGPSSSSSSTVSIGSKSDFETVYRRPSSAPKPPPVPPR